MLSKSISNKRKNTGRYYTYKNEEVNNTTQKFKTEYLTDVDEAIEKLHIAIESIIPAVEAIAVDEEYLGKIVDSFRSENWNNLKFKERQMLICDLNKAFSAALGPDLLKPQVGFTQELIDNVYPIYCEQGYMYINKEIIQDNVGLTILREYISFLELDLLITSLSQLYSIADSGQVYGLTKIYFNNLAESVLYNGWKNFLTIGEADYIYQPMIIDTNASAKLVINKLIKNLYKKHGIIDNEMSLLINDNMNFFGDVKKNKKERSRVIKNQQKNIDIGIKENKLYCDFLYNSMQDLSVLSDEEFFELLNVKFCYGYISDDDGFRIERLNKVCNELFIRNFRDFDLSDVEIPSFDIAYNEDKTKIIVEVTFEEEKKVMELEVENAATVFNVVLDYMSVVAQRYKLFHFKDQKEEEDYDAMFKWYLYKNGEFKDSADKEIANDGLNPVQRKVSDMYDDLVRRINSAIANSRLLNTGVSMIRHDNKEAFFDYHEFKNCYTKEEICEFIVSYVNEELEFINKGGR